ncbi:helix-turn-helix domain-containing protein [Enterococcus xiangfangensis]|uniref:Helix-turn-helix domain-containing protein n=1 Tax=Enterococcus xiangfangensis TaxID=1296537 RepID=A0ABU3F968_9ENTE|nr:helix-turn-helix domain-containing protein [Enterococcus xiangfangensis]MDT2758991.1 helix-turn-helix domain-containing protein [Enterococcus xiangfangensis]
MLEMDRNTLLKIQIIEILDGLQEPTSLKELQAKIGSASLGTIRVNCKELQTIIDKLYTDDDYSLKLRMDNGRGIQLDRSSTNLQSLTSYLYQHDLACEILHAILAKRKISAIQFCMDKNISESKLRRKIREINQGLTDYDLYISCSAKISLKGREIDIRRFYYLFIRELYHQFNQIEWINPDAYLQIARQIEADLKLISNPTNLEIIGFWLLIVNQSLSQKGELLFTSDEKEQLEHFDYPKKPIYLRNWTTNDWHFFLYALYSSFLTDFELATKKTLNEPFLEQAVCQWVDCFSRHFRPLDRREQEFVAQKIKQHYAALNFFKLNDSMIDRLRSSVALNCVRTQFPYYFRQFEAFWDDLTRAVPDYDRNQLRVYSFLTCVTLFSLENCLPEISVCAFSEYSELFSIFIRQRIRLYFKNRYRLQFVEDPKAAQLIIGTSPTCKSFLLEGQESIIIRSNISETDYHDIEMILAALVKKDLAKQPK